MYIFIHIFLEKRKKKKFFHFIYYNFNALNNEKKNFNFFKGITLYTYIFMFNYNNCEL